MDKCSGRDNVSSLGESSHSFHTTGTAQNGRHQNDTLLVSRTVERRDVHEETENSKHLLTPASSNLEAPTNFSLTNEKYSDKVKDTIIDQVEVKLDTHSEVLKIEPISEPTEYLAFINPEEFSGDAGLLLDQENDIFTVAGNEQEIKSAKLTSKTRTINLPTSTEQIEQNPTESKLLISKSFVDTKIPTPPELKSLTKSPATIFTDSTLISTSANFVAQINASGSELTPEFNMSKSSEPKPLGLLSMKSRMINSTDNRSSKELTPDRPIASEISVPADSKTLMVAEAKLTTATKTPATTDSKFSYKISKATKSKPPGEHKGQLDNTDSKLPILVQSKLPILSDHRITHPAENKLLNDQKIPVSSEFKTSKVTESEQPLLRKSKLPISEVSKKMLTSAHDKIIESNISHLSYSATKAQGGDESVLFVPPPASVTSDRVSRRKHMRKELIKARSINPNWMDDWESAEAAATSWTTPEAATSSWTTPEPSASSWTTTEAVTSSWTTPEAAATSWTTPIEDPNNKSTFVDNPDAWKSSDDDVSKKSAYHSSSARESSGLIDREILPAWQFSAEQKADQSFGSGHDLDVSFDDNFVVDRNCLSKSDRSMLYDAKPVRSSEEEMSPFGFNRYESGAKPKLKEVIPDCVLEREPLLEDEDDSGDFVCGSVYAFNNGLGDVITDSPEFYKSDTDSETTLLKLKELANLLLESERTGDYPSIIELLNGNLDRREQGLTLASLQILVRFSSNPDLVPYLLAARVCFPIIFFCEYSAVLH